MTMAKNVFRSVAAFVLSSALACTCMAGPGDGGGSLTAPRIVCAPLSPADAGIGHIEIWGESGIGYKIDISLGLPCASQPLEIFYPASATGDLEGMTGSLRPGGRFSGSVFGMKRLDDGSILATFDPEPGKPALELTCMDRKPPGS